MCIADVTLIMLVPMVLLLTALAGCGCVTQETLDYISTHIDIKLDPIDNTAQDLQNYVPLLLTLANTGDITVTNGNWKLYFNIMYGARMEDTACNMHLGHVNGLLYYLNPFENFTVPPHKNMSCTIHMYKHGSSRSDFMPNWYVASTDEVAAPRIIKSTSSDDIGYVGRFDSPNKWKPNKADKYIPVTPEERFRKNENHVGNKNIFNVIPTPLQMTEHQGFITFDNHWTIKDSVTFQKSTETLTEKLNISVCTLLDQFKKTIEFKMENVELFNSNKEAYKIEVNKAAMNITITSLSEVGAFYGAQTLIQLVTVTSNGTRVMPVVTLVDRPRYGHRGLMVDVARNYHGHSIMSIIDIMGRYKLNKLHLHVTDDEGWRLEIPSIPELTNVGSNRCHHTSSHIPCLIPSHGSGPYRNTTGTGFISVDEFRNILQHAENNHVTVILEIEMPGHSRAAWRSVNSRNFNASDASTDYQVDDLDDLGNSEFNQRWKMSTLNPCLESTYTFIDVLMQDIVKMYHGIQELKQLHVGGDEVVFAEWLNSTACKKYYRNITLSELNKVFFQKTIRILKKYAIYPVVWEESVYKKSILGKDHLSEHTGITVQTWYNIWELGRGPIPVELANLGHDVIMSPSTHLYLDHAQEPDPEERGVYYATRFLDTYRVFSFNSRDIYKNIDTTTFGEPLNQSYICSQFPCPMLIHQSNIKGIEACLWTETVRTERQLFTMLFPRLLAVAERAWHEAPWESIKHVTKRDQARNEDWDKFRHKVGSRHLPELPHYRVPPPGAILDGTRLRVNMLYTNHVVEIDINCRSKWAPIGDTVVIPKTSKTVCLRSRPVNRRIYSRAIQMETNNDIGSGKANTVTQTWPVITCTCTLILYTCIV